MPRFDRVYRLVAGTPGQKVGTPEYAATRTRAEALLAESRKPGLTDARRLQLSAEMDATRASLEGQAAGRTQGRGVEIGPPLRMKFDIKKDDGKNPNRSRVTVFNLKPETRRGLEEPDVRCVLDVGYAEEGGPSNVFTGDVIEAYTEFDGPDIATVLELGEGVIAIRDGIVSLGYPKGSGTTAAIRDVASRMGLSLVMPEDAPEKAWQGGFSFHGAGRSALDQITRYAGLSWSIQGTTLQVVRTGGTTNRQVFVLNARSGLIKHPERVRSNRREAAKVTDQQGETARVPKKTEKKDGWRVTSLVLPSVLPGDRVKLESRTVEGVFVVEEVQHQGDTHGDQWFTELKLIEPQQATTDQRHKAPQPVTRVRQSNAGGDIPPPANDPLSNVRRFEPTGGV